MLPLEEAETGDLGKRVLSETEYCFPARWRFPLLTYGFYPWGVGVSMGQTDTLFASTNLVALYFVSFRRGGPKGGWKTQSWGGSLSVWTERAV